MKNYLTQFLNACIRRTKSVASFTSKVGCFLLFVLSVLHILPLLTGEVVMVDNIHAVTRISAIAFTVLYLLRIMRPLVNKVIVVLLSAIVIPLSLIPMFLFTFLYVGPKELFLHIRSKFEEKEVTN